MCMRAHTHESHTNTHESHTPFSSLDHTQNTIHTFAMASKSVFSVSLNPDPPPAHISLLISSLTTLILVLFERYQASSDPRTFVLACLFAGNSFFFFSGN